MTPIGGLIIALCIFIGITLGCYLFKHFPNLFGRDKKMKQVLNNPHLLVEKLKESGKIYDMGKELDIKVGIDNETGKEVVVVEEKESKKAKEIQKKVEKDKTKTKKKIKKRGKK